MRVLHVIASGHRRGAEVFASELIHELNGDGIEQLVAVVHGKSGVVVPFSVPVVSLDSGIARRSRLGIESSVVEALRRLIRDWKPEVVQAHGGESLERSILANRRLKVPVVYRKIGVARRTASVSPRRTAHGYFVRRATKLIAVAEAVRENTISLFRIPPAKIVTIPNAIDPRRVKPDKDRREVRRSLGIPSNSRVMLSLGALVWEKEPLTHLAVGERMVREGLDVVHVFAGDGPLRNELEDAVRSSGLENNVRLLGNRSDVGNLLAASDLMLHASRGNGMEGMPACLIEAGMAGVPVCAYSVAGISEVVDSGRTGLLAPPNNVDQLAECAARLLKDDSVRSQMGEAARRRCHEDFDIRRVAQSYLAVYGDLVSTHSNGQ